MFQCPSVVCEPYAGRVHIEAGAVKQQHEVCELSDGVSRWLVFRFALVPDHDEYVGLGYGRPTEAGIAAIRTVAENEGVILDPVYTGKCMSALLDMAKNAKLKNPKDVVFLHTGGAPAIHPYADFFRVFS